MNDAVYPYGRRLRRPRRPRGRVLLQTSLVALLCGVFPRLTAPEGTVPAGPGPSVLAAVRAPSASAWMLDPTPALGASVPRLAQALPLAATLVPAVAPATVLAMVTPRALPATPMRVSQPVAQPMAQPMAQPVAQLVPLPVPRPAGLLAQVQAQVQVQVPGQAEPARFALRSEPTLRALTTRRTRTERAQANAEAERSFFDTVFGTRRAPDPEPRTTLAYASVDPTLDPGPRRIIESNPGVSAGTAVYDITARTVTLPSGERLEAHSGLGESMDNPRHVHRRMRGSTPPGTYDLTEREALFHGVRAIRLNPVGGSAAIHGRDGILAHTYMLGPSGASNGCVSFRDYNRFLQAYLRGEVRRLVVVAGRGDAGPSFAERLFGRATR
ncbi:DUF2778 domain-containing protein [Methylobacterium sp. 37f]|uniref:DUF2778 domain-containing protein n=1 Tax=Methylobacterium sp. 37f TaxID=2817058 RepID=UPI001FFDE7D1|nr:DUF2778 domain-containing protein [Methylobacterium sp. 37f]MCK2053691.1 DUF2778 domain-containing protein [Methylobacterium sp. 37f]